MKKIILSLLVLVLFLSGTSGALAKKLMDDSVFSEQLIGEDSGYKLKRFNRVTIPEVELKKGEWDADSLTVTMWVRLIGDFSDSPQGVSMHWYPFAFWIPEPINNAAPDFLKGAGGFYSEAINLDNHGGHITWQIPFSAYMDANGAVNSYRWPNGVATIAGETEKPLTVSVGGNVVVVEGKFNKNVIVGNEQSFSITGSGLVNIGVSQTPLYPCYGSSAFELENGQLTSFNITNEWTFIAWRLQASETNQLAVTSVFRLSSPDINKHYIDSLKPRTTSFNGQGYYNFAIYKLVFRYKYIDAEMFGVKAHRGFLTEEFLKEEYERGKAELIKQNLLGEPEMFEYEEEVPIVIIEKTPRRFPKTRLFFKNLFRIRSKRSK